MWLAWLAKWHTYIHTKNLFTVQLHNQTQHTVRGRVLRTKVDRKVTQIRVILRTLFPQQRRGIHPLQIFHRSGRVCWVPHLLSRFRGVHSARQRHRATMRQLQARTHSATQRTHARHVPCARQHPCHPRAMNDRGEKRPPDGRCSRRMRRFGRIPNHLCYEHYKASIARYEPNGVRSNSSRISSVATRISLAMRCTSVPG